MSATSTATDAQAATGDQAQAATTTGGTTTETTPAVESISLDEAKKLRSEAKSLRDRLRAFEKAEEERKNAELSEVERRDKEIGTLREQLTAAQERERTYALRDAIDGALRAESFAHTLKAPVADLLHFLPADLDPEDGKAVAKALGDLTASRAYLFEPKARRPGSADAGGGTGAVAIGMNDMIRRAAGRP